MSVWDGQKEEAWADDWWAPIGRLFRGGSCRRTFDTADSGRMMPPTLFVGATIFSTRTRSRRGIRRLAILRSSVDSESKRVAAAGGGYDLRLKKF